MKTARKFILLALLTMLVLAGCSQTNPKPLNPALRECPVQLRSDGAAFIDPCDPDPDPDPQPQPASALASWDELVAKADQLQVSLGEAASPYIEEFVDEPVITAQDYPRDATDTQNFVDKLFANSPLTQIGTLPDPIQNPGDPCVTTLVDYTTPPGRETQMLYTLEEYPGILWPGALYQGKTVPGGIGSLVAIPVDVSKRQPISLVSDTAFIRKTTSDGSSGAVYEAIGQIMQESQLRWKADPSKIYTKIIEASSLTEVGIKTGLNASAFGATLSQKMDASSSSSQSNVYVVFWQTLFNVYVDERGARPIQALFNSNLTVNDLNDLGNRNELGYDNLPTYIRSVSYGRFMIARYSSSKNSKELKYALDVKFSAGDISGGRSLEAHYKRIIDSSEIEVVAIGGPYDIQKEALKTDGWKAYFERTTIPLNTLKPISFNVHRWDGQPAKIGNVLKYLKRECPATPAKIEVRIENRKGDTTLYVTKAGQEQEILHVVDDGSDRVYDITSHLSGNDDNIRVRSSINKYGLFGTSRRDTKVTFIVDGIPTDQIVEDSCGTCGSTDLGNFLVNSRNGKVQKR
jgi:hypothetical protein